MTARRTTLLAAAALALGAAGCGAAETATKPVGEQVPAAGRDRGSDALPLGRGAVSPFVDYGTPNAAKQSKVAVSVLGVRKGRVADFEGFTLDRKQRRATPYYVDARFENRGSFALSPNLLRASLEDRRGREYRPTTLIVVGGSFRKCPEPTGAKLRPGRSLEACSVVLLPKGARPGRARFQGDVSKDPLYWETGA